MNIAIAHPSQLSLARVMIGLGITISLKKEKWIDSSSCGYQQKFSLKEFLHQALLVRFFGIAILNIFKVHLQLRNQTSIHKGNRLMIRFNFLTQYLSFVWFQFSMHSEYSTNIRILYEFKISIAHVSPNGIITSATTSISIDIKPPNMVAPHPIADKVIRFCSGLMIMMGFCKV